MAASEPLATCGSHGPSHSGRDPRGVVPISAIALVLRFWRLAWPDRLLLLEATFWLAVAAFTIAVLPFRHVGHLAERPIHGQEPPQQERAPMVRRIRWAVIACAH